MIEQPTKWRGEGITEALFVIGLVGAACVVVSPLTALILLMRTDGALSFVDVLFVVNLATAVISAGLAAFVAHRAHWRGGGIAVRASACGAAVAAFGLAWFALVRACFDL
jgi:hypothetical protein